MRQLIEKLRAEMDLSDEELLRLLKDKSEGEYLRECADEVRQQHYGKAVYIRGLIEISNYCKNDCLYCGIRRSNNAAKRYRLTREEILDCCETGYGLGFRTFVMQGGEDKFFSDNVMCEIVAEIKRRFPDCAVTLSLGERSRESYQRLYDAGADRYLLRHETANECHYQKLHPKELSLKKRRKCLFDLKEIGYQTGSGFMVGSPYQTTENIIEDLRFLQKLKPDMIGIGPFITHKETPFADFQSGSLEMTIKLISILRLIFPRVLLPATTALGTIHPQGREMGLRSGANVVMPNLSPQKSRKLYDLYDNKISTGEEAAESVALLKEKVVSAGYEVVIARGDVAKA